MKIVVLDGHTLNPGDLSWDGFKEIANLKVYDRTSNDEIIDRIGDFEIVITNKTPITADVLSQCSNIKYIGVLATGYNVVDIESCKKREIVVTNIPNYGTRSVSQFAFALLLEICHNVGLHSDSVKKGEWSTSSDFCFWHTPLIELENKNIGIIGFGKIGKATAEIAQAFGMKVLAYDPLIAPHIVSDTFKYVELNQLYNDSDVISLHCPLLDSTKNIINKVSISKMKEGVIIINTSRGQLVDERDLKDALESGKVYAAGLDVLREEPPTENSELLKMNNCIVTPHIAWASKEARSRIMKTAIDNLKGYLEGKIINCVSK